MNGLVLDSMKEYMKTQPINKAWVFGSFSRGEECQNSDIDILIEYDRENNSIGLFKMIGIQQELQKITGHRIDLVEKGTLMPFAMETANRDKILIYERKN